MKNIFFSVQQSSNTSDLWKRSREPTVGPQDTAVKKSEVKSLHKGKGMSGDSNQEEPLEEKA